MADGRLPFKPVPRDPFLDCGRLPKTGYGGQRYEVRALRPPADIPDGPAIEIFVVGWTEQEDGGGLVAAVKKHPTWEEPTVVDLGEEEWNRRPSTAAT